MKLPMLIQKPGVALTRRDCQGEDGCGGCPLYRDNGGRCGGCTPRHREQLADNFRSCFGECHECTGFQVEVTAICCRSPLKDVYLTAVTGGSEWNAPTYQFTERAAIRPTTHAIPYFTSGGISTVGPSEEYLVESDIVAVNLSRVWGGRGFYSRDMKDYFRLPARTKLVLLTMTKDDVLERAWEQELYADPLEFSRVGFDYWMPLQFSAYPEEAKMHQYYQLLRTLRALEQSRAWFMTGDHHVEGFDVDDLVAEGCLHVPQITINTQFVTNDESLRWQLRMLRHWHATLPDRVAFFLVGQINPRFVTNVRAVCGARALYFISSKPFYLATKGQALRQSGKAQKSTLDKYDLFQHNLQQFAAIVDRHGAIPE